MNTEELKETIADSDGELTATDLLYEAMPKAPERFERLTNNLAKLLTEVREHFPEARYYTCGGDGFGLVLGETHSGKYDKDNSELLAITASKLTVTGGTW
ncbi:hypothetical protein [Buttiauxella gaviniae]|jgi:hypothetical protein|uniref:hypothetical protein n=1 Tax=Buttiauxella gaviniae TaxID=82990 RepID=UPI003C71A44E